MKKKIQHTILLFSAVIIFFSCSSRKKNDNPHIEIETMYGEIEVELYPKQAPVTVAAFLKYVDSGYYDHGSFYRVLNNDNQPPDAPKTQLIQGGVWKTKNIKTAGIAHETTRQTGIMHHEGTISLARQAPGTANTEFFICLDKEPGLDYGGENCPDHQGYAAFGKVVKGMEIVHKIYAQNENDQYFDPPVTILRITR